MQCCALRPWALAYMLIPFLLAAPTQKLLQTSQSTLSWWRHYLMAAPSQQDNKPCDTKELKKSTWCPNPKSIDSALELALTSGGMDTGDLRLSCGVWYKGFHGGFLEFCVLQGGRSTHWRGGGRCEYHRNGLKKTHEIYPQQWGRNSRHQGQEEIWFKAYLGENLLFAQRTGVTIQLTVFNGFYCISVRGNFNIAKMILLWGGKERLDAFQSIVDKSMNALKLGNIGPRD